MPKKLTNLSFAVVGSAGNWNDSIQEQWVSVIVAYLGLRCTSIGFEGIENYEDHHTLPGFSACHPADLDFGTITTRYAGSKRRRQVHVEACQLFSYDEQTSKWLQEIPLSDWDITDCGGLGPETLYFLDHDQVALIATRECFFFSNLSKQHKALLQNIDHLPLDLFFEKPDCEVSLRIGREWKKKGWK